MELSQAAVIFLVALLASAGLTPLARRLGILAGLVDQPRAGELQRQPVPRTGGYAIIIAFALAVGVSFLVLPRTADEYQRLLAFALGVIVILPIALFDDLKRLGAGLQLIGQSVIAGLTILLGVLIDNVANPFGGLVYLPLLVAIPFTYLWIVGMVNTMNLIDTMDGLAAGVAAIAAVALFVRSYEQGQFSIAVLPLALVGACAGFLPFNFYPARIFMGTSGSMLLGYSLAVLAIIGGAKIATALMVLGLPIVDVAAVVVQRSLAGRSPFKGGDDAHLAHHLVNAGWSQRRIAFAIYAVCGLFGWLALSLSGAQKLLLFAAIGVVMLLLIVALLLRRRLSL